MSGLILPPNPPARPLRAAVLASGRGSNLLALLAESKAGRLPNVEFALVLSNLPGAGALEIAQREGIPGLCVHHRSYGKDREAHEAAIIRELEARRIDFLILAGYMRLLTPVLVGAFAGRMINIHPSLLPAFAGIHAQSQAHAYGVKVAGCTAHFVTLGMDEGPIIAQRAVPAYPTDTEADLSARILAEEHRALPLAVDLFSRDRLRVVGRRVVVLRGPGSYPELEPDLRPVAPLFVATGNAHKLGEISAILGDLPLYIQGTDLFPGAPEPDENGSTYIANAQIKARAWGERTGAWTLADDSGLEVDALDGRPGIHSSRYAPTAAERNARMLAELDGVPDEKRTARFACTVVLRSTDGREFHASGTCEGHIAHGPRGAAGFGYDPIFVPDGFDGAHLAELGDEVKNRISHRARALAGLREALRELTD